MSRRTALLDTHLPTALERFEGRHIVVCTCGWRSLPHVLAESSYAVWEEHRAAAH